MSKYIYYTEDHALPNLGILEYEAMNILASDDTLPSSGFKFEIDVFLQIWGSTSGGFDCTYDGTPTFSGSAMTQMYTTVIYECRTNVYLVFFGNRFCYKVDNPNDIFLDDLKNRNMKSLSEAKKYY